MDSIKIDHKNTLMIAHRGLSGIEKENTMPSFCAAGARTYYGIECDIHPTIDGTLVVIHDSDTARVAGKSIIIEKSTYEEVKQIELLDKKGEENHSCLRIPTFIDYLECCIRWNKVCVIEFKEIFEEKYILQTLKIVEDHNYMDHCVFISFWPQNIMAVRKYSADITLQLLLSSFDDIVIQGNRPTGITLKEGTTFPMKDILAYCSKFNVGVDVNFHAFTSKEVIDNLHNMGIKVNAWTVDNPEDAARLISYGIDFITTNILE